MPTDLDAMVEVPAGEFIYQDGTATIEKRYLIDEYPVTNQQYEIFIKTEAIRMSNYGAERGWYG